MDTHIDLSKAGDNWEKVKSSSAIPIASLGLSAANFVTNASKKKRDKKFHQEQMEAINRLVSALDRNSAVTEDINRTAEPNEKTTKHQKSNIMEYRIKRKSKNFSIESGGYTGGKRTPGKGGYGIGVAAGAVAGAAVGATGSSGSRAKGAAGKGANIGAAATIGAVIGAGLGALTAWMINRADKSVFNIGLSSRANSYDLIQAIEDRFAPDEPDESETTVSKTDEYGRTITTRKQFNKKKVVAPKGVIYEVDDDPRKYQVSLLYSGNVLCMFIYNPSAPSLRSLDSLLDGYCYSYKNANYYAEKVDRNTYVVELAVVSGTESYIAMKLIDSGIKVNVLTGDKFGYKKV